MQLQVLLLGAIVLSVNCGVSLAQSPFTCPNAEDIAPCVCKIPGFFLICADIHDVETLRTVSVNLEGVVTRFVKLWLSNSSLQYLPKELLEVVKVKELHIENVQLQSLFHEPPSPLKIFEIIRLKNMRLIRGVVWKVFSQMENLKTIEVDGIPVPIIGKDFSQNVPHKLRELELLNTKTKKFQTGTFEEFKDLEKLEIFKGRLEEINRDIFPVPFNIETIFIVQNRLKSIPDDLFTNMPNLKDVHLGGNQLSTIPESAFGGRFSQLERLLLRGNPLKCDCALRWIVVHKPDYFDGTCVSPKVMHGKELNMLSYSQFHC